MFTVVETPMFSNSVEDYWSESERGAFAAFIALNPEAGAVVPGSRGCRKVRWSLRGRGKRGGVRVIYFNQVAENCIYLLLIYAKTANDSIPANVLLKIKETLNADE